MSHAQQHCILSLLKLLHARFSTAFHAAAHNLRVGECERQQEQVDGEKWCPVQADSGRVTLKKFPFTGDSGAARLEDRSQNTATKWPQNCLNMDSLLATVD